MRRFLAAVLAAACVLAAGVPAFAADVVTYRSSDGRTADSAEFVNEYAPPASPEPTPTPTPEEPTPTPTPDDPAPGTDDNALDIGLLAAGAILSGCALAVAGYRLWKKRAGAR